jgi:hypothetical protein
MQWLRAILREILGLFIDDGSYAGAILAWLMTVWLVLPRIGMPPRWGAPVLFVGLAVILIENASRYSRLSRAKVQG